MFSLLLKDLISDFYSITRDLPQAQMDGDKKLRGDIKEGFERRVKDGELDIELKGRRISKKKKVSGSNGEVHPSVGESAAPAGAPGPF